MPTSHSTNPSGAKNPAAAKKHTIITSPSAHMPA
jgi:hypothetical protein